MPEKISLYVPDATSNPITGFDYLDFSNSPDSGSTWDVSKKILVNEFMAYVNSGVTNIYNSDGSIDVPRTLTSNGSQTRWLGGDVVVEMSDEINDYAFLIHAQGGGEYGRLGYDQVETSGVILLNNIVGEFFKVHNNEMFVNTDGLFVSNNSMVGINQSAPVSALDVMTGDTGGALSMYLDEVGGATNGRQNSINFYANDSSGTRRLGNINIVSRIESTTAATVETSLIIGDAFKVDDTKRFYFGNSVTTENSALAQFYIKGLNHANSSTFLLDGSGTGTALAFHLRNSNGSASMMQVNCQSKVTFNVSKQSTGDFNVKGWNEDNLFYTDASADSIGIGTNLPNVSSIMEFSSTTKGVRYKPMTAAQASAISPVEGLVVFSSDTDATFLSVGLHCYENGAWNKL